MLRRQRRVRHVLSAAGSLAALVAAGLLAGCGGAAHERAASADQDVVAKAVTPPPLADASRTPRPAATETQSDGASGASDLRDGAPEAEGEDDAPAGAERSGAILSARDRVSFDQLAASLGGRHGLAVSGVGTARRVEQVGALQSAAAWSTAKVPIAMAVIDAGRQSALRGDLVSAITASDNAAATRLWAALGPPAQAARAADAQLRRAGDSRTQIETRPLRGAGYTPFGQTSWSLAEQARFTAGLPCSAAGVQVLTLMGQVVAGQRWGLGSAGVPAQLKGGWGPGAQPGVAGGYLDRQMGIVTVRRVPLAVAIASAPADGSHQTGAHDLTEIARWLIHHAHVTGQPADPVC